MSSQKDGGWAGAAGTSRATVRWRRAITPPAAPRQTKNSNPSAPHNFFSPVGDLEPPASAGQFPTGPTLPLFPAQAVDLLADVQFFFLVIGQHRRIRQGLDEVDEVPHLPGIVGDAVRGGRHVGGGDAGVDAVVDIDGPAPAAIDARSQVRWPHEGTPRVVAEGIVAAIVRVAADAGRIANEQLISAKD